MNPRIEDYALIGDCETAALVSRYGSIDWLCWPNFDSPACFASMLGTAENGRWYLGPVGNAKITRRYRPHTLILETTFETETGSVLLIDCMLPDAQNSTIVRVVRGLRGKVAMALELVLRFDYGRSVPWVTRCDDGTLRAIAGPDMVAFRTPLPIRGENLRTLAEFDISEGEEIPCVLNYSRSHGQLPPATDYRKALGETELYWVAWTKEAKLGGPYAEAIERSLITLKALTYRHTGGIVAAPTTSLPEQIGGPRNWDYRFCWLRDATFTLLALMHAGYYEEARAWRDWLLRAVAGSPNQVQIMYGICGERLLSELELPWLKGYENSRPVRIGNAASEQLQLDVYGEVADALFQATQGGIRFREVDLRLLRTLIEHLAEIWQQPDEGIWEVRGGPQHFTYSKVMAWVAFDRGIKSAECFGLHGPVDKWREMREQIRKEVCEKGFNQHMGSFVQAYGSKELDASLLLIPLVGFLPPDDPRVRGTIEAVEKHLMVDGFVMRYDSARVADGLPEGEGAFLACSFWMVSALKLIGRVEDAQQLFERLLTLRNDVGLLAEEYGPRSKRQLGNFPQALSHIALVNAGFEFTKVSSPGQQRAESNPDQAAANIQENASSPNRTPAKP